MPAKRVARKVTPKTPVSKRVATLVVPSSTVEKSFSLKTHTFVIARKPQIFIPIAFLLAIVAVYLLKSFFVVATVNGQFISRSAFETALVKQDGKQIMNSLVTQKLIEQEAAKKGITVSQSDIDAQAKTIDKQLAAQGQTLDQALATRGMTRAEFNEQVKLQQLLQKLLASQIKVTDQEIQDYIDKNKDSLPAEESDAQVKVSVKQQLEQQKLSTAAQAMVQKLQTAAHISYFINL